ncbi:hypothetical protein B296_00037808, partial [Ensete ventricosum]
MPKCQYALPDSLTSFSISVCIFPVPLPCDHSILSYICPGASAAVNAIILLNVFLFPKNIYYINFIIPVPAALM